MAEKATAKNWREWGRLAVPELYQEFSNRNGPLLRTIRNRYPPALVPGDEKYREMKEEMGAALDSCAREVLLDLHYHPTEDEE